MAIDYNDGEILRGAGFSYWEIEQFASARNPDGSSQAKADLNSDVWRDAIQERRAWRDERIQAGWSQEELDDAIQRFYLRDQSRSPWDFLKSEYKPAARVTQFKSAADARARTVNPFRGIRRTGLSR